MKISKGIKLLTAALSTVLLFLGVSLFSKKSSAEEAVAARLPVNLNETLTNEMSDTSILAGIDAKVKEYMTYWGLKGVSLSVMRNDSLLYAKGFGIADTDRPMEPGNILRVASVSKLVTAVGIMVLQDRGQLSIKDTVFGPGGILNDSLYVAAIRDPLYRTITVEDLLRHRGGFSRRGGDPMFSTRWIMMQNGWTTVPTHEQLMELQLKRPLRFAPGTAQEYSNFGYLALSMIIEKVSGMSYEDFIQQNVLHPAGCLGFRIAGNYYKDKYPEEVRYYVQHDDEPADEFNNSGRKVVKCYGENDIPRLQGAGAWCASAAELSRFIAAIDGMPGIPDILSATSIEAMTREMPNHAFSLGWNFTPSRQPWNRTGTLSGTSALVLVYPDGECWIILTNTSTWKGQGFAKDNTAFFNRLRNRYSHLFPARDLFP